MENILFGDLLKSKVNFNNVYGANYYRYCEDSFGSDKDYGIKIELIVYSIIDRIIEDNKREIIALSEAGDKLFQVPEIYNKYFNVLKYNYNLAALYIVKNYGLNIIISREFPESETITFSWAREASIENCAGPRSDNSVKPDFSKKLQEIMADRNLEKMSDEEFKLKKEASSKEALEIHILNSKNTDINFNNDVCNDVEADINASDFYGMNLNTMF